MSMMVSQITSLTIVYSSVYSDADQRKHQSSASLAFVRGIDRGPVNSPHKWPVTRKIFPFDDVIMVTEEPVKDRLGAFKTHITIYSYIREFSRSHDEMPDKSRTFALHMVKYRLLLLGPISKTTYPPQLKQFRSQSEFGESCNLL